jgi:hypothetical protein
VQNFEWHNATHKELQRLADREQDKERRDYLRQLEREAWRRLTHCAQQTSITFAQPCPGYWLLGMAGSEQSYAQPSTDGLGLAWDIFLNGDSVRYFYLNERGGALRNKLRRAADWVRAETHCYQLADAIEGISISQKDGSILHVPRVNIKLE